MRIVMFYHSLISDWNHGNAHFLRGIITELMLRGHRVSVFEPRFGWSLMNLIERYGETVITEFRKVYPHLSSTMYTMDNINLDKILRDVDLVIVHEWNDPAFIKKLGNHRKLNKNYRLLFHDTHHRSLTDPSVLHESNLRNYDGVLAYGSSIAEIYRKNGWAERLWIWHEAADTRVFHPLDTDEMKIGDLVWIGNWGDGERTEELKEYLIGPVRNLDLKARAHGVRYPQHALSLLWKAGMEYFGWLPNYKVPQAFAFFKLTVHIPRKPYIDFLPGIPTIRPFEALACGIPLICSNWHDSEGLFTPGKDYLLASSGDEMENHIKTLLNEPEFAKALSEQGRKTILARHTCAHRVEELLKICTELSIDTVPEERRITAVDKDTAETPKYMEN